MKPHSILLLALTSTALAQGPLTPPQGANPSVGPVNALNGGLPQATMKSLHQVEPRTAIPSSTSTVAISQSGSYYLTGDITVADGSGIVIGASRVNLDLNGFSIVSTNASPDTSEIGVAIGFNMRNITIRNGIISGDGSTGKFYSAIGHNTFTASTNVSVVDVTTSDTTHWGIILDQGSNSRVERCFVKTEGITGGIQAGLVADCSVIGGAIFATSVRDSNVHQGRIISKIVKGCTVTTSGTSGIVADVVENCYATSAGTAIQAKCLVNSYGTGSGNQDVISAGVAQNVWAEATDSGKAIKAVVVGNSSGLGYGSGDVVHAKVVNNVNAETSSSAASGVAIQATVVGNSTGTHTTTGNSGEGIKAIVVQASHGVSTSNPGINATVVTASRGESTGNVGILGNIGAISLSSGNGLTGLRCDSGLVFGSQATGTSTGLVATNGLVSSCRAEMTGRLGSGIDAVGGHVSNSQGLAVSNTNSIYGIKAYSVIGSWGFAVNDLNPTSTTGVFAERFAQGTISSGVSGVVGSVGQIKFDSN
jgi:hypothetical protein